jgi:hypothetical protein
LPVNASISLFGTSLAISKRLTGEQAWTPETAAGPRRGEREMRRYSRYVAVAVAVLAGLTWSWFDTRTYIGLESPWETRWRIGALAVMLAAAFWAWSRSHGGSDLRPRRK